MKYVNFVAPIHLPNKVSRIRIWISGTSAVTILVLIVAWFLAPPKELQVTPRTPSQLATKPDNNFTVVGDSIPKSRIAEVITAVHHAVHEVEPKTLQIIELAHTPEISSLTFAQADSPTPTPQNELRQVVRLLQEHLPHAELITFPSAATGSDSVRVIEMSHIRVQNV